VQDPAITVVAIIDSPLKGHHGGDVGGPVFNRVAQAALAYLNVPHDADVKVDQQHRMLRASAKDSDFSEGSPDHPSDVAWANEADPTPVPMALPVSSSESDRVKIIEASFKPQLKRDRPVVAPQIKLTKKPMQPTTPVRGTVILDAENGTAAPSFIGKSVRAVIEEAQRSGLEVEIVGSGVARQQVPAPGEAIPAGTRITVEFSR